MCIKIGGLIDAAGNAMMLGCAQLVLHNIPLNHDSLVFEWQLCTLMGYASKDHSVFQQVYMVASCSHHAHRIFEMSMIPP